MYFVANASQDTITVIDATEREKEKGKGKRAKGKKAPASPRVIGHRSSAAAPAAPIPSSTSSRAGWR